MRGKHAIEFFDEQFQRQLGAGELALNPFESLALPYLTGEVLDLGCGLGNLALAAARQGCRVHALDGSATAIAHIRHSAAQAGLPIRAEQADLAGLRIEREYDAIVSIGLLMFLPEAEAHALLEQIRAHVRPGGIAALNVLTEGTTYLGMFQPGHHHLFRRGELGDAFPGWPVLASRQDSYPAPDNTLKVFDTLILRRPA